MVLRLLGITEAELTIFSEYISHATVNSMKLLDNPESGWVWGGACSFVREAKSNYFFYP
jgi:hypothetical protein